MKTLLVFVLGFGLTLGTMLIFSSQSISGEPPILKNNIAMAQTNPANRASQGELIGAASSATVTMVFINTGDPIVTARAAEELASLVEQETGYTVYSFLASCPGAAVDMMAVGEADFGWLSSLAYVFAHDRAGIEVKLIAERGGSTTYRSQFIVRSDSGINTLDDLAGKNFAFVDSQSASGFMYPALYISNTQGVPYDTFLGQTVFAGSHPGVVQAVYDGQYGGTAIHAGACFEDARAVVGIPDVFSKTKVIAYTDYIPNDTVSVRPEVDPIVVQKVISGLVNLAGTPEWDEIMVHLYNWDGTAPGEDSVYDVVRQVVTTFGLEFETCSQVATVTSGSGGSLEYVDTSGLTTTLQIPPGAVTDTLQLSLAPIPAVTYLPASYAEIGHSISLIAVISGTAQSVTSLSEPYTLTFSYEQHELEGIYEGSLAVYWWDGTSWVKEPTSAVDPVADIVSATPDHFSSFAVLGVGNVYLPLVVKN
jgi:phosphonate transport system substrate-binding protein